METTQVVKLEGELTLHTVAASLERPIPAGDFALDLSGVTRVDSAALALLLAWLRRAKASGSKIELRVLPGALDALARLYGIDPLLPHKP
ncbi:MAG: STAS domain-containing protein [Azoarcus sp.]|jgi:phospholipid transport system transporter-binding protein|nr:STAS domain-containing protein [Azoarcus sp.]